MQGRSMSAKGVRMPGMALESEQPFREFLDNNGAIHGRYPNARTAGPPNFPLSNHKVEQTNT
jgi:hypothetical protein